jgi:hypothetical protein
MKKRFLLFLLLALTSFESAQAIIYVPAGCKFFDAVGAGADRVSDAVDTQLYNAASFQVNWSSLTGSVDGSVKVQVSNDLACSTCWVDKTGATFSLLGASGSDMISLSAVSERFYRVYYAHGSISGGALTGFCWAKQ